jgi:hypothetical protein
MKNFNYTHFIKIFLVTVALFALSWLASIFGGLNHGRSYPVSLLDSFAVQLSSSKDVKISRKFPSTVRELDVSTTGVDVTFAKADGNEIEVRLTGRFPNGGDHSLSTFVEDSRLSVRTQETDERNTWNIQFDTGLNDAELLILLPAALKKLTLKTISGDVKLTERSVEELQLESTSGDLAIKKGNFGSVTLRTVSGDLSLKECRAEKLMSQSVSGDLSLMLRNLDPQVTAKTTSGDVEARFEKIPNARVEFVSVSGELNLEPSFGERSRTKALLGNGKGSISVRSISGDLNIGKF